MARVKDQFRRAAVGGANKRRSSGTENRKRGRVITARFSEQEAAAIRRLAEKSGLSVGALIRQSLLDMPPPRAMRRPSIDHQAVAKVLAQLGKIGSNINQLAHHANAGRPLNRMSSSLDLALRDLAELRLACLQALGHEPEHPDPE